MAVTLFLTSTASDLGSIPATPSGYWEIVNSTFYAMKPSGTVSPNIAATVGKTSSANPADVLMRRWVSDPFQRSATLAGGYTVRFARSESNAALNALTRPRLIILRANGTTQVIADTATFSGEFPTTLTAQENLATAIDVAVAVVPGDRLILEIGFNATTAITTYTATIRVGGSATPLVTSDTGTNATTRSPHLLLSDSMWDDLWTPEPVDPGEGGGTPQIIASYKVDGTENGADITVPNVQPGDWIIASPAGIYGSGNTMTVSGTGAGTWEQIGTQLGDPELAGGNIHFNLGTWRKIATGSGSYDASFTYDDYTMFIVYHLRGCQSVVDFADVEAEQDALVAALSYPLGPIDSAPGDLALGFWGGTLFDDVINWTSATMTRDQQSADLESFGMLAGFHQVVTTGPTFSATATADPDPGFGMCGRLMTIRGFPESDGLPPGQMLIAYS